MNCQEAKELMAIGVFGKLTSSYEKTLRIHIEGCAVCREKYEKISKLPILFPEEQTPDADWEKIWDAVTEKTFEERRSFLIPLVRPWALTVASLLIVFMVGFLLGKRFFSPSQDPVVFSLSDPSEDPNTLVKYAESLNPILVNFLNRSDSTAPKKNIKLEKKILRDMLMQTRILRRLTTEDDDPMFQHLLDDLEFILVGISNLVPGDREGAALISRLIRKQAIRSRLDQLTGQMILF